MALGNDSGSFLISEGVASAGVFTNPELIGTNATDPSTFFSGNVIGYLRQGSINIDIPREYAEFLSSTPGIMIRKDLIRKQFAIEGESGQWDGDSIQLFKNTNSQLAYNVTIPVAQTWDIHHIGSDEPVQATQGILLDTKLTNGNKLIIGIYAGRFQTEDNSIALSGTDYAAQAFRVDSFVHPGFVGVTDEAQKHYGIIAVQTA